MLADAGTQTTMGALGCALPTSPNTNRLSFELPARPPSARRWALPSTRCAAYKAEERRSPADITQDYYQLLGVSVDASYEDIRKAYRKLQKKHHPDVAGPEGHAVTLLLNEAYQTLTNDNLRHAYPFTRSKAGAFYGPAQASFTGVPYSKWSGPDRPQGIFVDENACIGCRECVFRAGKTFSMDESCGRARVTTQWGDYEPQIKVALEACPVNCIHYVEKDDLPFLEFLMRPQPKVSNGVYGGGWERPTNIFMAARTFKRKFQADSTPSTARWRDETPAQRKARMDADFKVRAGAFWWLWSWGAQYSGPTADNKQSYEASNWPWKGLFGRSSTSELLSIPIDPAELSKVVEVVQEWAVTFASSSELPLPLPFRSDNLPNGVQLTLITASNGVLGTMGSLLVTVVEEEEGCFLIVKRQGVTGTGALPGERTIVQYVKDAVRGRASSYNTYHIPRS